MSVIENVTVPNSLIKWLRELAEKEGVTVEQFVSSAIAEKAAAWMTVEYLEQRAARGSEQEFRDALRNVPDREPDGADRIK
jgi:hypothetical protein